MGSRSMSAGFRALFRIPRSRGFFLALSFRSNDLLLFLDRRVSGNRFHLPFSIRSVYISVREVDFLLLSVSPSILLLQIDHSLDHSVDFPLLSRYLSISLLKYQNIKFRSLGLRVLLLTKII